MTHVTAGSYRSFQPGHPRRTSLIAVVGCIAGLAGCKPSYPSYAFPVNPTVAAQQEAGNFYSNAAVGITVTGFPWIFTTKKPLDGGYQARQLTGLVTIAGMGAHHVQVTEDDDYLDPNDDAADIGAISVDIVDMDSQDPGRTYVVSSGDASLELFDYQADGDPLGFYYNSDDGTFDILAQVDAGMEDGDSGMDLAADAKAAVNAILNDERFSGANPYGFAMAYAMGMVDPRQLCWSSADCPVQPPVCPAFPGICDCSVCAKLGLSTCPNCQ